MPQPAMKFLVTLLGLVCLSLLPCMAETWTSVKGEKLEGLFVSYNLRERRIKIIRGYDRQMFSIKETELIPSDRLRAVKLQNPGVSPYWYGDFDEAQKTFAGLGKHFVFLCRNGSDKEAFEVFYHKLLLREDFRELLGSNNFIACVQEDLPAFFDYKSGVPGSFKGDKEYKRWVDEKLPIVFCGSFGERRESSAPNHYQWFRLRTEAGALREDDDFKPYTYIETAVRGYEQQRRDSEQEIRMLMQERSKAGEG